MEKWDLYTRYREKTGKEHVRGEEVPEGFYHLVVHVWIRNRKGEYLISQRSANRPTSPLMWECVAGSVLKGESSIEGALREVKEEIGLDLKEEDGKLFFSKVFDNAIMDVWLFSYDGEPQLEAATTDEVADCKWMTGLEVKELYMKKKLVRSMDYFFCAMSDNEPDYKGIIGKTVKGTVDRPLGTSHPRHPEMVYPINYGYVDGVLSGDGAEQDVYIFGTDKPLRNFEGKVIAVWHRFDDVDDKWIVSLDGEDVAEEKILGDISFQEQFFYGKLYR